MKRAFDSFYHCIMIFCKLLLVAEILIAILVVVTRYLPGIVVPTWSEETILTCMIYMAMLTAAMGLRRNAHIRMTAFDNFLSASIIRFLDLFSCFVVLAFALAMMYYGWIFAISMGAKGVYASMPSISKFWLYFPIPVSGLVTAMFEIEQIVNQLSAKRKEEKDGYK